MNLYPFHDIRVIRLDLIGFFLIAKKIRLSGCQVNQVLDLILFDKFTDKFARERVIFALICFLLISRSSTSRSPINFTIKYCPLTNLLAREPAKLSRTFLEATLNSETLRCRNLSIFLNKEREKEIYVHRYMCIQRLQRRLFVQCYESIRVFFDSR